MIECGLNSYQTLNDLDRLSLLLLANISSILYFSTHPPEQFWKEKKRVCQKTSFPAIWFLPPLAPTWLLVNTDWRGERGKYICNVSSSLSEFSYTVILNVTWTKVISGWGNQDFPYFCRGVGASVNSSKTLPRVSWALHCGEQARKCL